MPRIVVSPLARIAEMAVRHGACEMISLLGEGHDFHRPAVISGSRHLRLGVNDIAFDSKTAGLIAPQEAHVREIVAFARSWDQASPLLIHCWMGVSRSPAAAALAALAVAPHLDEFDLAAQLRNASPFATPNARLIAIGDQVLNRKGRLIKAIEGMGRGADASGDSPFAFDFA